MSSFQEIGNRRIIPAVGVYIGGVWVIIEILDRLVERYLFSPYITDIAFWGLYSLLPAVILIAWTHGKPGKDQSTRLEKVGVPVNIIATLGLLITIFGGKDLGATANLVTLDNELGQQEEHYIPRDSYRRRMAIFFWENESEDSELDWLQYGVTELLAQDLRQSPFMLITTAWSQTLSGFYNRMRQAGFDDGIGLPLNLMREIADSAKRQYFAEGSINRSGSDLVLEVRIWETESLVQVGEVVEQGADLLPLIDRVSRSIRAVLEVPSGEGRLAEDLPLSETYGESNEALQQYISGKNALLFDNDFVASDHLFDKALEIDPNFVLAWYFKAINQIDQGDIPGAQLALAEARKRDFRLPSRDQDRLKAISYRLSGEQDKLEAFLRMQVKIREDVTSQSQLARFLLYTGRLEQAKESFQDVLELDATDLGAYLELTRLARATGDLSGAVNYANIYNEARPEDVDGLMLLGDLSLDSGDIDAAKKYFEEAQILDDPPLYPTLRLAKLAFLQGEWSHSRGLIAQSKLIANGAAEDSAVLQFEGQLESRLGHIRRAQELLNQQAELDNQWLPPTDRVFNYVFPFVHYSLMIGEIDEAESALDRAREVLQPPMDQFLAFSEANVHAYKGEFDQARLALSRGEDVVDRFKADFLAFQIPLAEGTIAVQAKDYAHAADRYAHAMQKMDRFVIAGYSNFERSIIAGASAQMYVLSGDQVKAQQILDDAFLRDDFEPSLWVARAMVQKANGMEQMAIASINYALAIWENADPEYLEYQRALEFRDSLLPSTVQTALSD